MPLLEPLRQRARRLETETFALYLAARDPRTPWYAKLLVAAIVAYALSPIDLIPDFVPILGYLDDLILIPLGIAIAVRLVPPEVLADSRTRARAAAGGTRPVSRLAGAVVIALWLALAALMFSWAYEAFASAQNLPGHRPAGHTSSATSHTKNRASRFWPTPTAPLSRSSAQAQSGSKALVVEDQ
ncbi:YkvA family protein [Sulfurifustis variabilis]|uniref:YkvA family protein n=1 Tax=Sulfurifustis variabilis TaxID=1675686 RepID=UPI0018D58E34|nr:YkvA family protein [Sulfurifustis variabilis]